MNVLVDINRGKIEERGRVCLTHFKRLGHLTDNLLRPCYNRDH